MAKKKVSHSNNHQEKPLPQKQDDSVKAHQEVTPPMDSEASEKLESLKSLNQILVKESFERRQQVESLVQSKESLETELARSNSEMEELKSELTRLNETAAALELERSVVAVFVAEHVSQKEEVFEREIKGLEMELRDLKGVIDEKKSEIGSLSVKMSEIETAFGNEREVSRGVCVERDEIKSELDRQIEESKGLKANLLEFEVKNRDLERAIGELRITYNSVVGEKEEREMRIESILSEKDSMERSLMESNKLTEKIKEELVGVVREKEVIEEEKNVEITKRKELENAVSGLNEMVVDLQKEEAKLQAFVAELEKKCVEGEERHKDMVREINQLMEEKKSSEKKIEGLADEKTAIEKDLGEALEQLAEQKHKTGEIVTEKIVILEAKDKLDNEVGALKNQVAELKAVVLKLEEYNRDELEKIKNLESEKKSSEKRIEGLANEKTATGRDLEEALEQLAEQKHKIEVMVNEKIVILEAKDTLDNEVGALKNQVAELKAVVLELEGYNRDELEKIKNLESEVGDYRCKLEEVKIQRDDMQKIVNEEKKNGVRLNEKISKLEKKVEESLKASEELKAKNGSIFAEKVELESQCEKLKKGILSLESTIIEAQNKFDSMKVKFESVDAKSELVLSMLKDTAEFCSKDEADVAVDEILGKNGEESKGSVVELEMIKNAFKSKVTKVETMKRQMELLKNSVEDAHKKKSFWTVLSSATTLLAAISLAYVARGH